MNCIKSTNILANTVMFPGSLMRATYDQFNYGNVHTESSLLFIPDEQGSVIPAILILAEKNSATSFCIHFHGNACDVAQVLRCAVREAKHFNSHYLIVEYPRYGIMHGFPTEKSINQIAVAVHNYVIDSLKVPPSRIILIGRSIGSGPACFLAGHLERTSRRPAAVVLQSPFTSVKDAARDLVGCTSLLLLDRWENWRYLCGDGIQRNNLSIIKCPVLLIHAEDDQVISYHHSKMLHETRRNAGYPCELFTQKSTGTVKKGHNIYDFRQDYLLPTKEFLSKYVSDFGKLTQTSSPISSVILPLDVLSFLTVVPHSYAQPTPTRKRNCASTTLWCMCPYILCLETCLAITCCSSTSLSAYFCRCYNCSHGLTIRKLENTPWQSTTSVQASRTQVIAPDVHGYARLLTGHSEENNDSASSQGYDLRNTEPLLFPAVSDDLDTRSRHATMSSETAMSKRMEESKVEYYSNRMEDLLRLPLVVCFENPIIAHRQMMEHGVDIIDRNIPVQHENGDINALKTGSRNLTTLASPNFPAGSTSDAPVDEIPASAPTVLSLPVIERVIAISGEDYQMKNLISSSDANSIGLNRKASIETDLPGISSSQLLNSNLGPSPPMGPLSRSNSPNRFHVLGFFPKLSPGKENMAKGQPLEDVVERDSHSFKLKLDVGEIYDDSLDKSRITLQSDSPLARSIASPGAKSSPGGRSSPDARNSVNSAHSLRSARSVHSLNSADADVERKKDKEGLESRTEDLKKTFFRPGSLSPTGGTRKQSGSVSSNNDIAPTSMPLSPHDSIASRDST